MTKQRDAEWGVLGRFLIAVMMASAPASGVLCATSSIQEYKSLKLATVSGIASTPRWAPGGSQIALLVTIDAKKKARALEAAAPQVGEIGSDSDDQRLAVISRRGGEVRLVSPADTYIYEYDCTPDGTGFVVTAATGMATTIVESHQRVPAAAGMRR